jgi:hypothetical protein
MVMVAAGTRAPDESVTVPVIVDVVESWANAQILQMKTIEASMKIPRKIPVNREARYAPVLI